MAKIITKTNPDFIERVKNELASKKEKFERYFSIIETKQDTIAKLKQMRK